MTRHTTAVVLIAITCGLAFLAANSSVTSGEEESTSDVKPQMLAFLADSDGKVTYLFSNMNYIPSKGEVGFGCVRFDKTALGLQSSWPDSVKIELQNLGEQNRIIGTYRLNTIEGQKSEFSFKLPKEAKGVEGLAIKVSAS